MKEIVKALYFFRQKLGNELNEYEDSFCYNLKKGKFAIADGASDCCFAKTWAAILTSHFVKCNLSLFSFQNFSANKMWEKLSRLFIAPAQKVWVDSIDWANLKWNVLEKALKGAYASFLGLEIKKNYAKSVVYAWRAIAVGDCCMFILEDKKIIDSFPLRDINQFRTTPPMLSSIPQANSLNEYKIYTKEGEIREGGIIILATDAIAKWIIQSKMIIRNLVFSGNDKLCHYFTDLIERGEIKNDDITFVRLIF